MNLRNIKVIKYINYNKKKFISKTNRWPSGKWLN